MDWIERILGVSPDGGSGTLEVISFAIPIAALYLLNKIRLAIRRQTADRF